MSEPLKRALCDLIDRWNASKREEPPELLLNRILSRIAEGDEGDDAAVLQAMVDAWFADKRGVTNYTRARAALAAGMRAIHE